MGFIADTANVVYDDYNTHGVPSSGPKQPSKAAIRSLFASIDKDLISIPQWYGAKGDGVTDDSAAVQAAFDTCRAVFFPKGTYLVNVRLDCKVRVYGEGSAFSIIKPFDPALAAFTLTGTPADWSMSYVFECLGFHGVAGGGIGVTFAKTDPNDHVTNDEYIGRATFNNCIFQDLNKGIQRPFGNLGLYLNECSFFRCYYGTYSLDNKFGGDQMHAGCLYVRGGATMICDCGHYFHDGTTQGFGGIEFNGHIFERNYIGLYGYFSGVMVTPIAFRSYWNEAQGALSPAVTSPLLMPGWLHQRPRVIPAAAPPTVAIDAWTGSVKSTQNLAPHAFIFDGDGWSANFRDGAFTDVALLASNSVVISEGERFESAEGYGGAPCVITHQTNSRIVLRDSTSNQGGALVPGIMLDGLVTVPDAALGTTGLAARSSIIPFRGAISTLQNLDGASNTCNVTTGGAADFLPGAKTITAATQAGQGSLYANAAAYSDTLTSAQYCRLANSAAVLSAGWFAWSVDVILLSGTCRFLVSDLGTKVLGTFTPPADTAWHCWGGVGYLSSGSAALEFYLSGAAAGSTAFTFWLRNYQLKRFVTRTDAQDFMRARIYAV